MPPPLRERQMTTDPPMSDFAAPPCRPESSLGTSVRFGATSRWISTTAVVSRQSTIRWPVISLRVHRSRGDQPSPLLLCCRGCCAPASRARCASAARCGRCDRDSRQWLSIRPTDIPSLCPTGIPIERRGRAERTVSWAARVDRAFAGGHNPGSNSAAAAR
jgi:hypothetical protein